MSWPIWHNRANKPHLGDAKPATPVPSEPAEDLPTPPAAETRATPAEMPALPGRSQFADAASLAADTLFYPGGDLLDFGHQASSFDLDFSA